MPHRGPLKVPLMPIEPAVYLNTLVSTNPVVTDPIGQGDDHIRLIKSALQSSFPLVAGAASISHTDLTSLSGFLVNGVATVPIPAASTTTGGELVLKGAGTHADLDITNASGTLTVTSGATLIASLLPTGELDLLGPLSASSIKQGGNPLIPAGVIVMWSGSVASIPAGWLLCNGASGTPDLRDRFLVGAGNLYSPGASGGVTTQTATTSSSGSHSHTGSSGLAGSHTPAVTLDVQGSHSHTGGTQSHTLLVAEIPSHLHDVTTLTSSAGSGALNGIVGALAATTGPLDTTAVGGNGGHSHGITADGSHTHTATGTAVGNHSHTISLDGAHTHSVSFDNRPLFYSLAYIMKS